MALASGPTTFNIAQTVMVYQLPSQINVQGGQPHAEEEEADDRASKRNTHQTLEEAIQTVIHDPRTPKKPSFPLAAYEQQAAHLHEREIPVPPADQAGPNCLARTISPGPGAVCQAGASQSITNEDRYILNCGHALIQRQITISLWHNDESLDWSIEIDGQRHDHVTSDITEALVECALIVAQIQLTKPYNRRPQ